MKGLEHGRNDRKKAKLTLKEKRLAKKEKRSRARESHEIHELPVGFE